MPLADNFLQIFCDKLFWDEHHGCKRYQLGPENILDF